MVVVTAPVLPAPIAVVGISPQAEMEQARRYSG